MNLVEKIPLPNGLSVEVWDGSVPIAADTTKVVLLIRIMVPVHSSYFTRTGQYEKVINVHGSDIAFEYQKVRTFVKDKQKKAVFQELLDDFKESSLAYLGRPTFARSFALAKYAEIERNNYKYSQFSAEDR